MSALDQELTARIKWVQTKRARVATINGADKMSYAELLKLQERIEAAIADKCVEDAADTKKVSACHG